MLNAGPLPDVAFVCHAYHRGGVTRWMVDAAIAWRELGGRAWLLAPTPRANGRTTDRPSIVHLAAEAPAGARPEVITWPLDVTFEYGTSGHRAFTYAGEIERSVPAGVPVIVSDDSAVWAGAAMVCARNPLIGVVHSDEETYYEYIKRYQRDLSGVVCVSRRTGNRVAELVTRDLPIATIPCGVPMPPLARPNEERTATSRIAWVGRMEEAQKRVSDLPKIARGLRDAGVRFHLDLVGDGPAKPALVEQLARDALASHVSIYGWRDRSGVRAVLDGTDVYLLPSNFEGMSVSVMEALASGCAIVSSRTSGIEDYATHAGASRCVWTYPVGDVAAAVQSVRDALAVPRAERCQRSLALAQSEFSIERCVRAYAAFVGRLQPPASNASAPSRRIRARLNALMSQPIAAWRSVRVARAAR